MSSRRRAAISGGVALCLRHLPARVGPVEFSDLVPSWRSPARRILSRSSSGPAACGNRDRIAGWWSAVASNR